MDSRKNKPSRVQGAWGGGGRGPSSSSSATRKVGTIGQRRLGEKLHDAAHTMNKVSVDSGKTDSNLFLRNDHDERNVALLSSSLTSATSSSSNFIFRQPSDKELFRKPPEEIVIQKEGLHEISVGPDGPARLRFFPQLFEKTEADWIFDDLLKGVPWGQQVNRKEGREEFLEPRLTCWFGDFPYHYSGVVQEPRAWTPIMTMLKDKIEELTGSKFNSCLANYYRNDKDSIAWHSDNESILGNQPVIASLSFGDVRVFELRQNPPYEKDDYRFSQIIKVPLPHGSLLVMEGATQTDWQHRVPKEYHDRDARINLTFRTIYPEHS